MLEELLKKIDKMGLSCHGTKLRAKKMRGKLYLCSLSQFQTTVEIPLNVTANRYHILGSFAHI